MKTLSCVLMAFGLTLGLWVNLNAQCGITNTAKQTLSANNFFAEIGTSAKVFTNESSSVPNVPGIENPRTFFTAGLWMGAVDAANNLKVAARKYSYGSDASDYYPGPINDQTGQTFQDGCLNFDFIWKVNRHEILDLIADFEDNNSIDNPIAANILNWPSQGNPHFENQMGFELPNQDLAPFFDRNGNGIYEPQNGEYPVLDAENPQVIPDQMLWTVFNDIDDIHYESQGAPLGVEVQMMAYAFLCEDNSDLNNTIFTRVKVINKSQEDLYDFRFGLWMDPDLGCHLDDYIGCQPDQNTAYIYNSDNVDGDPGNNCQGGVLTYDENPPVQFVTFLNQPLDYFRYMENSAFGGNPGMTDPNVAVEYFNYLHNLWRDGTPLTQGGTGYNLSSTDLVNHAYPNRPDDLGGWSQFNLGISNGDYRILMSTEEGTLPAQSPFEIDMAYTYYRAPNSNHLENVNGLDTAIPNLQSFYDNQFSNECTQLNVCEDDCVWPGDMDTDGIARHCDLLPLGIAMGQVSGGNSRFISSINWSPHDSENWNETFLSSTNYKHADSNGDGLLNEADQFAIEQNYNLTNPNFDGIDYEEPPFSESDLILEQQRDEISVNASSIQKIQRTTLVLGTEDEPIESIYGIAITLKYDPNIMEESLFPVWNFDDSFLGDQSELLNVFYHNPETGIIEIAISRKDGQNVNGFGGFGKIWLTVKDDLTTANDDGKILIDWEILEIKALEADETPVPLGATFEESFIVDVTVGVDSKTIESSQIEVLPNPNNGQFRIDFSENLPSLSSMKLYNNQGQLIDIERNWNEEYSISKSNGKGIFFLTFLFENGEMVSKKIIVQ